MNKSVCASNTITLTYSTIDGVERVIKQKSSSNAKTLEYVRLLVEKKRDVKYGIPLDEVDFTCPAYQLHSGAVGVYERFKDAILNDIARVCYEDPDFAKLILADATAQAKKKDAAAVKSLAQTKAKITRMINAGEHSWSIIHEYCLLLRGYGKYELLKYDFEEPVCACCGRTFDHQYMLTIDGTTLCASCIDDIETKKATIKIPKKTIKQFSEALRYTERYANVTDELIEKWKDQMVAAQKDFLSFASEMADHFIANGRTGDTLELYNFVWVERTKRLFASNIDTFADKNNPNKLFSLNSNGLANELLTPRYTFSEIETLFKQLVAERSK